MNIKIDSRLKIALQVTVALLFVLVWISIPAFAGSKYNRDGTRVDVDVDQKQIQKQQQMQTAECGSAEASASNDGNTLNVGGDSVQNNSSNVVLVPNNNTESCLRVFGIAWGKNGESGALGVPWRSKKCDYEQAADDAFAAGEREIGWFWKCENPNLYKTFKSKGESNESAKTDCLTKMVGSVTQLTTINTLRDQLTASERERNNDRTLARESNERITQACNESKNRLLESCAQTK
jgi:hypothetical protein